MIKSMLLRCTLMYLFVGSSAYLHAQKSAGSQHIKVILTNSDSLWDGTIAGRTLYNTAALHSFYERNKYKAVWMPDGSRHANALWLMGAIRDVEDDGLMPHDYHLEAIEGMWRHYLFEKNPRRRAELELLLSDAWFMMASHLLHGKTNPSEVSAEWRIERDAYTPDLAEQLQEAFDENALFSSLDVYRPGMVRYQQLRMALRFYRMWLISHPWPELALEESLKPGMEHSAVDTLRQRLILLGDLSSYSTETPDLIDSTMAEGLKRFQLRHGLHPDAVVGKNTLAALNSSPAQRMRSAMVNLERLRWLPDRIEAEHIMVNIANFQMDYILNKDTLLTSRAVVGTPFRRTPVFSARMNHLVFSPSWTVPPGILRNDVIPAVRKNVNYLAEKGMLVIDRTGNAVSPADVDWQASSFPYTIRQRPGPLNALGKAKFMFPNTYAVYIHDTPTRNLFERDERAFSSGCVRISKPFELAEVLLRDNVRWDARRIREAMNSGVEQQVNLSPSIAVYLTYFTAWSDGEKVHFRKDIYDRDAPILKALQESIQPLPQLRADN